jgi:hypothetical protein
MSKVEENLPDYSDLAVEAFKVLLDVYYYNLILWNLQSVCTALWI